MILIICIFNFGTVFPCALRFMVSPLNHTLSDFGQGPIRPLTYFSKRTVAKKQRISLVHSISSSREHPSSGLSCFRALAIHSQMIRRLCCCHASKYFAKVEEFTFNALFVIMKGKGPKELKIKDGKIGYNAFMLNLSNLTHWE